jgi:class 3 adenylate cyclase
MILSRYRGEERDAAGDGFFATFDGPARAIRCTHAIVDGVRELGLDIRVGVHTGECEVHEDKVAGLAVVIGARVAALANGGEVLVSQTVKDLVAGAGIDFDERGEQELKGVPVMAPLRGCRRQRSRSARSGFLDCRHEGRADRRRGSLADWEAERFSIQDPRR